MTRPEEIEQFILQFKGKPLLEASLALSKKEGWPKEFILNQINGQQKSKQKFPFLIDQKNFTFPSPRAVSQASSENTARYKSNLISGKTLLDLSGGMGIDSYFFAQKVIHLNYVEQDKLLFNLTKKNLEQMGLTNCSFENTKAEDFLQQNILQFDVVYLDPDRREKSEKAVKIEDCRPNLSKILPDIFNISQLCLIKLSPLLDIKKAQHQLPNVKEIHIVSVHNDCKELLFLLDRNFSGEPTIHAVNLNRKGELASSFSFQPKEEKSAIANLSAPIHYLYEPNVSLLKSGAFKLLCSSFSISKLAKNTHLYTSGDWIADFPGRKLKIISLNKPQNGVVKKANVVSRNFPMKPDVIRKKYKIEEGDQYFLYACTLENNQKIFIIAERI